MKIFNLIFCLLFLVSAALQYNDPDPWIWMPLYLFGAVMCWYAFRGKIFPKTLAAGIIVYGIYAIYLFFAKAGVLEWITQHHGENIAVTMQAEKPWIEETREFFGLIILIVVLGINFWMHRKITSRQNS